ncbi:MAG: DUF6470 family protein [Solibacillus sp.]
MRIPQIQLQLTDVKMDWQIHDPVQKIKQPEATLNIDQPAAIIEINTTNPELDVDMTQFWRDVHSKPTGEFIKDAADKGRQAVLQGISKRVSEGRQLLQGAGKGGGSDTIKNIAKQNFAAKRVGPYNIDFIPSFQAIKASITPGTIDINIEKQAPKIDVQVNKPIHDYTVGKVTGNMLVRPDVKVDVQA